MNVTNTNLYYNTSPTVLPRSWGKKRQFVHSIPRSRCVFGDGGCLPATTATTWQQHCGLLTTENVCGTKGLSMEPVPSNGKNVGLSCEWQSLGMAKGAFFSRNAVHLTPTHIPKTDPHSNENADGKGRNCTTLGVDRPPWERDIS